MIWNLPKPVAELMAEVIASGMRLRGGDKEDMRQVILRSPEEQFITLLFAIKDESLEVGSVIDSTVCYRELEGRLEKARAFLKAHKLKK